MHRLKGIYLKWTIAFHVDASVSVGQLLWKIRSGENGWALSVAQNIQILSNAKQQLTQIPCKHLTGTK